MLPFRVAFTGAQGTGKSTLAHLLTQALRERCQLAVASYIGLGETATRAGLLLGERASADAVRIVARLHQMREADADRRLASETQVFDRCLLDCLAYADVLGGLPIDELGRLADAARRSCRRARLLVCMRITSDYPVLTDQDESPAFRRAIENAIHARAHRLGLPMLSLSLSPSDMAANAQALAARLCPTGG